MTTIPQSTRKRTSRSEWRPVSLGQSTGPFRRTFLYGYPCRQRSAAPPTDTQRTGKRKELYFHKRLLNETLPLCIGGGIGQSRLCMLYLQKAHIGEIQASIWPEDMRKECAQLGMQLI